MISVEVFEYYDPKEVRELEAYTTELEKQVEAMKCCGTCTHLQQEAEPCQNCFECSRMQWSDDVKKPDNWQLAEKRGE